MNSNSPHAQFKGPPAKVLCHRCHEHLAPWRFHQWLLSDWPVSRISKPFCIACGIHYKIYQQGDVLLKYDGSVWWMCCGQLYCQNESVKCTSCYQCVNLDHCAMLDPEEEVATVGLEEICQAFGREWQT